MSESDVGRLSGNRVPTFEQDQNKGFVHVYKEANSRSRISLLVLAGYRPTFICYLYYNKDFYIQD